MLRGFTLLLLLLSWALARAGSLAEVEVFDRTTGVSLPVHEHRGRLYVVGEPRHRYELRVRNRSGARVLAVASVDGVNVISGETAAQNQRGYVLDAYDSVAIDGWRKSLDQVATFYFTRLQDSYAARTGRPDNVGVIGVALFRERQRCCDYRDERPAAATAPRSDDSSTAQARAEAKLGTGHGPRQSSPAQYVTFHRASERPDETIVIYYDSYRNLVAQGIVPAESRLVNRRPEPFPRGFVPDP